MVKDNTGRRKARADTLCRGLTNNHSIYIAAACAGNGRCRIAAVDGCGRNNSSATVNTSSIVEVKEGTIAMGVSPHDVKFVLPDYKSSIRSYSIGAIDLLVSRLIKPQDTIRLMWVPDHARKQRNEDAHLAGRSVDNREVGSLHILRYHQLTQFYSVLVFVF